MKGFGFAAGFGKQQEKKNNDLFAPSTDSKVLKLNDRKNLMLLKRRNPKDDIWVVLLYRGGSLPETHADSIKTFSQKMKGLVRVGVLECNQQTLKEC